MTSRGIILISDKQAQRKPCLRCGYSLRHIVGVKNCPECGLAVRISLSGNKGLEWSSPHWQRVLAVGFCVLAIGMVSKVFSFAAIWIGNGAYEKYYRLPDEILLFLVRLNLYAAESYPILCGLGLCILAKGERRFPDKSRGARVLVLIAGVLLVAIGLLNTVVHRGYWLRWPSWVDEFLWYSLHGLWVPLIVSILVCSYALSLGKRSGSRTLVRLSQVPIWPVAAAIAFWAMMVDRLWWGFRPILVDAAFPLSMIVVLVVTIRVLLLGAREATLNWVTDP